MQTGRHARRLGVALLGVTVALVFGTSAATAGGWTTATYGVVGARVSDVSVWGLDEEVVNATTTLPAGKVTQFEMYFPGTDSNPEQVQFDVWRSGPSGMTLIATSRTFSVGAGQAGVMTFTLKPALKVASGDYFGVYAPSSDAPLSMSSGTSLYYIALSATQHVVGATYGFTYYAGQDANDRVTVSSH